MKRKALMVTGGLLVVGLLVGGARAADHRAHGGGGPGGLAGNFLPRWQQMAAELNLTADQKTQVRAALASHRAEIAATLPKVRDAFRKLDDTSRATPPDDAAVRAAAADVGTALADAAELRAKVLADIRPLLTADQQKKLDTMRQERRERVDRAAARLAPATK